MYVNGQKSEYLKIATWNLGNDGDYARCNERAPESERVDIDFNQPDQIADKRDAMIREIITNYGGHIYFLQEAGTGILPYKRNDRTASLRIEKWIDKSQYKWVSSDGSDTAIVYDVSRFKPISQSLVQNDKKVGEYTVIDLKEIHTDIIFRLASMHVMGSDPFPDLNPSGEPLDPTVKQADKQVQFMVDLLETQENLAMPDVVILGMDANAVIDYESRFAPLKQRKYQSEGQSLSTNYSKMRLQNLKIDHIFARGVTLNVEFKTPSDADILPIDRPLLNPSDHRPVFSYLKLENVGLKNLLDRLREGLRFL